jgi:NADH-quinone oxidoreductase subunit B
VPLNLVSLNLACCALEAATAVEAWQASQPNSDTALNVLVVAGTVTRSNAGLVRASFEALSQPRAVVAFGVCTISGGPYWDSYAVLPGIGELVPVTTFVPGCPPRPADLTAVFAQLDRSPAGVE